MLREHYTKKGLIVATLLKIGLLIIRDFIAHIAVASLLRLLNFVLGIGSWFAFLEELSLDKEDKESFTLFRTLQRCLALSSGIA